MWPFFQRVTLYYIGLNTSFRAKEAKSRIQTNKIQCTLYTHNVHNMGVNLLYLHTVQAHLYFRQFVGFLALQWTDKQSRDQLHRFLYDIKYLLSIKTDFF